MALAEDDDLVSYWEDFPRPPPPPQDPVTPGVLWFGFANGDVESDAAWYARIPVQVRAVDDRLHFKGLWSKPVGEPATMTRVGLWTTRTNGELLYWKDEEPVVLTGVGDITLELAIQDEPMGRPVSFRRMLKGMQLL